MNAIKQWNKSNNYGMSDRVHIVKKQDTLIACCKVQRLAWGKPDKKKWLIYTITPDGPEFVQWFKTKKAMLEFLKEQKKPTPAPTLTLVHSTPPTKLESLRRQIKRNIAKEKQRKADRLKQRHRR